MEDTYDTNQRDYRDNSAKIGLVGGSRLPLGNQEKAISELHEIIQQLTSRLSSVLTPEHDRTDIGNLGSRAEAEKAAESPLADQLHANNRGIHRASQSLRSIIDRIEC